MLKTLFGASVAISLLLAASGALARPTAHLGQDKYDRAGRPTADSVTSRSAEPKGHSARASSSRVAAPRQLDTRSHRGELVESAPRSTPVAHQGRVLRAGTGNSPAAARSQKVANCSEFADCRNATAHNDKPSQGASKGHGGNTHATNEAYLKRVWLTKMKMLESAIVPAQSCMNGTDCWLP